MTANGPMPMAMPPRPKPAATTLHPAAQEAAAIYSKALDDLDAARATIAELQNDNAVLMLRLDEVKAELGIERDKRESYERYCVEVNTHLVTIATSANLARDRSLENMRERKLDPKPTEKSLEEIDAGILGLVEQMNAAEALPRVLTAGPRE